VTLDTTGRMLLGTDIAAVLATLEPMGIDVIGLNCSTGPEHMHGAIAYLSEQSLLPISCLPNAGLPLNVDGQAVYPLEPGRFAAELEEFVTRYGVAAVGGCCGTTADSLASSGEGGWRPPAPAAGRSGAHADGLLGDARTALTQTPPPMLNRRAAEHSGKQENEGAAGRRRLRLHSRHRADQVEGGAHTLDICVALTERADEAAQIARGGAPVEPADRGAAGHRHTEADVLRAGARGPPPDDRSSMPSIWRTAGSAHGRDAAAHPRSWAAVIALTID